MYNLCITLDKCNTLWYTLSMKKDKENKTHFIIVRVTKEEKERLQKLSNNSRDSLSRYVRGLMNLNG